MEHRLDKIAKLLGRWHPRWLEPLLERLASSRAAGDSGSPTQQPQPQPGADTPPDFGPAQGGYGPAAAPGTALGGKGIFGPDVSAPRPEVGVSALDEEVAPLEGEKGRPEPQ